MSSKNFNLEPKRAISIGANVALGAVGIGLARRNRRLSRQLAATETTLETEKQNGKHDAKTGLLLYPAFEEEVVKRTGSSARAADADRTHAMVLLDLDDFKAWNTRLTHPRTDREALLPVAAVMKSLLRPDSDLASRFGGEEFALFLSDTDKEGARTVCEKVQGQINSIHPDINSPDTLGATMAYTTFSQGTYQYNLEDLTTDLSEQLLLAKEIPGKNQIVPLAPAAA